VFASRARVPGDVECWPDEAATDAVDMG
jgi:hypothetical protein